MPDWVLSIVVSFLFSSVLGWFVKRALDQIGRLPDDLTAVARASAERDEKIKAEMDARFAEMRRESEARIEAVRESFEEFRHQQPFLYVLREDWIRYQTAIEQKLDLIYKTVLANQHQHQTGGGDD